MYRPAPGQWIERICLDQFVNLFCSDRVSLPPVGSRRAVAIGKLLTSDLIEKEHGGGDLQSSALNMVGEHHTA